MSEEPEKIISLFGASAAPVTGEPNAEVIAVLERALELAYDGQLMAVMVAGPMRAGARLSIAGGVEPGTGYLLISAAELALFKLKARFVGDDTYIGS